MSFDWYSQHCNRQWLGIRQWLGLRSAANNYSSFCWPSSWRGAYGAKYAIVYRMLMLYIRMFTVRIRIRHYVTADFIWCKWMLGKWQTNKIISCLMMIDMLQWCLITTVNSLRPNDAIWRHRPWSTLTQVMACCLTAPSHNLNKMLSWERWPPTQNSFISMQYKNALVKIRIWKLFSFVLFCISQGPLG